MSYKTHTRMIKHKIRCVKCQKMFDHFCTFTKTNKKSCDQCTADYQRKKVRERYKKRHSNIR